MSKPIMALPKFLADFGFGIVEILKASADDVKTRMSEPGKPIIYPVQWDSEKQRRAYFASNGFGKGIPYNRTGAYSRSWTVDKNEAGAVLMAPHPAAAVGGFPGGWQSRIHRNRWNYLTRILFDELGKLPDKFSNLFKVIGR